MIQAELAMFQADFCQMLQNELLYMLLLNSENFDYRQTLWLFIFLLAMTSIFRSSTYFGKILKKHLKIRQIGV